MIFDSDLLIGTIILIIGVGYWSVSLVEHNNVYVDAVQNEYLFDKGISTMENLVSSGTLQNAVLLYYFDNGTGNLKNNATLLLNNSISLKHYKLEINGTTIINNNFNENSNSSYYVAAIGVLNRSEGWYVIYGDETNIHISNERYLDYEEAYNSHYNNNEICMPVYYSKNDDKPIQVKLYVSN